MVLTSRPRGKALPATRPAPGCRHAPSPGRRPPEKGATPARGTPGNTPGQASAKPLHRRRNATPSMTELKSYDLPELETLAEQIKAEIAKREQEEQEQARQAAEAEVEAARQAQAAAEAAAEKAAEAARKIAEKKEAARKEAARKTAEKKAAEEAARVAAAAPPPAQAPQESGRIRYMHPSNRALTWSGEGTMPDWINAWLVTGGTLYALEIAAEKLAPKPIPDSFKLR